MKSFRFVALYLLSFLSALCLVSPNTSEAQLNNPNLPGTMLVFPEFDIRGETSTILRVVNNSRKKLRVELNYVCPGIINVNNTCAKLDRHFDLTQHQTRIISVRDQNPSCEQGFVTAWVEDQSGTPISANVLTGSYQVNTLRESQNNQAYAFQAVKPAGDPIGIRSRDFRITSSNLITDFQAGSKSGAPAAYGSKVVLVNLNVIFGAQNPISSTFVDFWNAAEEPFSSAHQFICWDKVDLRDISSNFIDQNLGTSHGSMRIAPAQNCPIPGACPPFNTLSHQLLGSIVEYEEGSEASRLLQMLPPEVKATA